jgi:predicted transcriptional regulator of viral defense system
MEMLHALELLGEYTAEQWGMVTARQARLLGVDGVTVHRLKEAGFLEPVRRGVYAVTSAGASLVRDEQAVWLSLRPDVASWTRPKLDPDGAVISHRSAARIYGIGELVNDRVELTVPRRRTIRDSTVLIHQAMLTDAEVTVVDGLPVTTPLRTICDLLDQHTDASHIATVIRQAVEAGQVRLDELAERIGPYARRYGVKPFDGTALLNQLLGQIGMSITELATRPSPVNLDELIASGVTWDDLVRNGVKWYQLANMLPDVARQLKMVRQHTTEAEAPPEKSPGQRGTA